MEGMQQIVCSRVQGAALRVAGRYTALGCSRVAVAPSVVDAKAAMSSHSVGQSSMRSVAAADGEPSPPSCSSTGPEKLFRAAVLPHTDDDGKDLFGKLRPR